MFRTGWKRGSCHWGDVNPQMEFHYMGPCRCGTGPHSFYQDRSGRIIHPSQDRMGKPYEEKWLEEEIEHLKQEKIRLEKRIEELEDIIKGRNV